MELDFNKGFIDGRIIETEDGTATFKTHQISDLVVPTGFIVACDPFVCFDSPPFAPQIPVGTYPVILSVLQWNDDQRVAYAKLHISNEPSIEWKMALLPNQDLSTLTEEDEYFGYPVDAGTGCFMDKSAANILLTKDENYSQFMITEMEKHYVHTWDWTNIELDSETKANLIAFKSGLGDGIYPSYFGFDANGKVTSLVTDFLVVDDKEVYFEA
jgi:hypothetical protein